MNIIETTLPHENIHELCESLINYKLEDINMCCIISVH